MSTTVLMVAMAMGCSGDSDAGTDGGGPGDTETTPTDSATVDSTPTSDPTADTADTADLAEERHLQQALLTDILFVIDDSPDSGDLQILTAAGFPTLLDRLVSGEVDFHVGVTSTSTNTQEYTSASQGCRGDYLEGVLAEAQGVRWIDATSAGGAGLFTELATLGKEGSRCQMGMLPIKQALVDRAAGPNKGFRRSDAELHTVVISNEDDATPEQDITTAQFGTLFEDAGSTVGDNGFHGFICIQSLGCGTAERYQSLASALGGTTAPWEQLTDPAAWERLADAVVPAIATTFVLEAVPFPDTLVVSIERADGGTDVLDEAAGDYSYDHAERLVTLLGALPAPGDEVVLSYEIEFSASR